MKLRSQAWFASHDRDALVHRSWMKNQGIPHDQFDGRPVIGICNTWSQATPCNAHFRELAQHVRDGVLDARLLQRDVADRKTAARLQYAGDLAEHGRLIGRKIDDAIADHTID